MKILIFETIHNVHNCIQGTTHRMKLFVHLIVEVSSAVCPAMVVWDTNVPLTLSSFCKIHPHTSSPKQIFSFWIWFFSNPWPLSQIVSVCTPKSMDYYFHFLGNLVFQKNQITAKNSICREDIHETTPLRGPLLPSIFWRVLDYLLGPFVNYAQLFFLGELVIGESPWGHVWGEREEAMKQKWAP